MTRPPATEKQMKDVEFYGSVGELRMIADAIESCSLTPDQERAATQAFAEGIRVCRKYDADRAVRSILERQQLPEHFKVEMIYVCAEIGWAKPVRDWNPRMIEPAAREAARKTLKAIEIRFSSRDVALEPKIRPPTQQRPQIPVIQTPLLAHNRG
ncbi:MAG: hypothetical protein V1861_07155 [Candidatus Micrarchaeota archaeon]